MNQLIVSLSCSSSPLSKPCDLLPGHLHCRIVLSPLIIPLIIPLVIAFFAWDGARHFRIGALLIGSCGLPIDGRGKADPAAHDPGKSSCDAT